MTQHEKNHEQNRDDTLKLFVVLTKAYKAISEHAAQDVKRHGLNTTEFAVLELLYHKGEFPLQKIGERILISSGSMTYVVDKLEKAGYIDRKPCPNDRRVIYAVLTPMGKQFMDRIFPEHIEALMNATDTMKHEEKEILITLLKKLGIDAKSKLP